MSSYKRASKAAASAEVPATATSVASMFSKKRRLQSEAKAERKIDNGAGSSSAPSSEQQAPAKNKKASISHKSLPRKLLEGEDGAVQEAVNLHVDDLSSDDEAPKNTVGNVPLEWYGDYDHIGYDVEGKPIGKKSLGGKDRIDAFLKSQDDPLAFKWTVFDEANQEEMVLSKRDVQMLRNLHSGTYAHPEFDPTSMAYSTAGLYSDPQLDLEIHPLNGGTEPKRRFLPSKHELRKVLRLAKAIKEGRWKREPPKSASARPLYLLWEADTDAIAGYDGGKRRGPAAISAPKELPPGHASSYNPPPEYLLTDEEKKAWEECDPRERARRGMPSFLPVKFSSLRHVPLYKPGIRERFERCLDLYLCPRAVKDKLSISDPSTLLPKLPDPSELRPFPSTLGVDFKGGHELLGGRVRSISVDPTGTWLVSCGDDRTVRLWETMTGKCLRTWGTPIRPPTLDNNNSANDSSSSSSTAGSGSSFAFADTLQQVAWCPNPSVALIAVAEGSRVHLLYPGTALGWNAQATYDALRGARQGEAAASAAKAEGSDGDDEEDDDDDDEDSNSDSEASSDGDDAAAVAKRKLDAAKARQQKQGKGKGADRKVVSVDDEGETNAAGQDEDDDGSSSSDDESASGSDSEDGKGKGKGKKGKSESSLGIEGRVAVRKAKWTQAAADKFPVSAASLVRRPGFSSSSSSSSAASEGGVLVTIEHSHQVRKVSWQPKGDYLVAVLPNASSGSVMVHQVSRRASTSPFSKAHGIPQAAMFHPSRPLLYVANQHSVRVWDLASQSLESKLEAGVKWVSTMDVHPSGDHVVCGSFDARTVWFDTSLSQKPFKTLKYHDKGVRRVVFHRQSPLLATASDDGTLHVFHARVFDGPEDEFGKNPLIVPLKVLRGHAKTSEGLGVLDAVFHPTQPWLFSAGADGTIKLWHSLP